MMRAFIVVFLCLGVAACAPTRDLDQPRGPIGSFQMAEMVPMVSDTVTKGPLSRTATPEEWKAAVGEAFEARFRGFRGDRVIHLGFTVEGYVLAQPGIPIVASPKSVLIGNVFVLDDETREFLTEEAHQITVIESFSAANLFSSGLTSSKEEQMADLSAAAARQVEKWLRQQPWFEE